MNGKIEAVVGVLAVTLALGCGGSSAETESETTVTTETETEGDDLPTVSTPQTTEGETEVEVTQEPVSAAPEAAPPERGPMPPSAGQMAQGQSAAPPPSPMPPSPTAPPAPDAAAAPMGPLAGESCPTALQGVRVQVANVDGGARVTFTGSNDQTDEVRMRVQRLIDASRSGVSTTADASATAAPAPELGYEEAARGARVTIRVADRARLVDARREVRAWVTEIRGGQCTRLEITAPPPAAPGPVGAATPAPPAAAVAAR